MVNEEHWSVWTRLHNPETGRFDDFMLVYRWGMPKAEAETILKRLEEAYDDGNLFVRKA